MVSYYGGHLISIWHPCHKQRTILIECNYCKTPSCLLPSSSTTNGIFYPFNYNKKIEIFFFAIRLQNFSLIKLAAMKSQLVYNLNNVRRLIIKHMTKKRDFFFASTPWFYCMIAIWWCNESVANTIWNWLTWVQIPMCLSHWVKM